MVDITDGDTVQFVMHERILANYLLGIRNALVTMTTQYVDNVLPILNQHADGDMVADGADSDGRDEMFKSDTVEIALMMNTLQGMFTPAVVSALTKAHTKVVNPIAL